MANAVLSPRSVIVTIDVITHASDWLWAVPTVMIVSAIGPVAVGATQPVGRRVFHHLGAALCFPASIAYFRMISDLSATAVGVEHIRGGSLGVDFVAQGVACATHWIWHPGYTDWVITPPMPLLELLISVVKTFVWLGRL